MEKLIEKTDNLIHSLDNSNEVKKIKELNKKMKEEKELLKDIDSYKNNPTEELRQKIINNPFYREYKKSENDCNFLILEINKELKEITGGRSCENH